MAEHSPTPWRVADIEHDYDILDADGKVAARAAHGNMELAALIVEAVNERDRLREELDSVNAQLNWHKGQLKAVRADAESEERWANQYFEQAQRAEAERDRLRGLVRRLADELESHYHEPESMDDPCIIREAREAIKEDKS